MHLLLRPPRGRAGDTLAAIARWQDVLEGGNEPLAITFHGGEPLVPGLDFYRTALPLLRDALAPRDVHFGLQSNLWLLTDELCQLFHEYGFSFGTSLDVDGPEPVNDAQRGAGYFRRTGWVGAANGAGAERRLNARCRACTLRYLCDGFCRAGGSQDDPDGPPLDCRLLYARAHAKLMSALDALNVSMEAGAALRSRSCCWPAAATVDR